MCETKWEDGYWYGEDSDQMRSVRAVRNGYWAWHKEQLGGTSLTWPVGDGFTPLRRIADLDGKPVVDEVTLNAIASDFRSKTISAFNCALNTMTVLEVLRKHLGPSRDEGEKDRHAMMGKVACQALGVPLRESPSEIREAVVRLKTRIDTLEKELTECSEVMQRMHSIGEVKGIGLLEVAEAMRQVEQHEFARLQARIAELEAKHATPTATHRETATGDEWVFLPENDNCVRYGLNRTDKKIAWYGREGFAKHFTPLPEPAERPIVAFPGAFVCWERGTGNKCSAWPNEGGCYVADHSSGKTVWHLNKTLDRFITRTPPAPTLPPEHERLVGPIAAYFKVDESEARKALAGATT